MGFACQKVQWRHVRPPSNSPFAHGATGAAFLPKQRKDFGGQYCAGAAPTTSPSRTCRRLYSGAGSEVRTEVWIVHAQVRNNFTHVRCLEKFRCGARHSAEGADSRCGGSGAVPCDERRCSTFCASHTCITRRIFRFPTFFF